MPILKKNYSYAYHIHSRLVANDIEVYLREKYLNKIAVADSGIWQIDDIDIQETVEYLKYMCKYQYLDEKFDNMIGTGIEK